ncbi:DnaJ domain containing protein, putative [Babesia bigemina]|uniref:DnaJ domain containing protein, putative n=1 Tax=Babesia bigemina TaxID=5866 RepID=A0A061D5X6_BABBI|nr:DnaJ domain containing protein, putative [Babesia bigemina]CDR96116.1 DnaJ domain containing protein, putative [Babesia bigemina]|eukprot:XP_012768302.1 DnaJ domain containing protein, putative [Babesia bigemina]
MKLRGIIGLVAILGIAHAQAWGFFGEEPEEDLFADKKCPYEVLGVKKSATASEIKRTFRQLSKKYHPDVSKEPDAAERYKEINEAYDILNNADKRKAYDEGGFAGLMRQSQSGGNDDGYDINDIFSNIFGFGGGRRRDEEMRAEALVYPLSIPLDVLYHGRDLTIKIQVNRLCPEYDECKVNRKDCQAAGVRLVTMQHGPGMFMQQQVRDHTCIGRHEGWKTSCSACPNGPTYVEDVNLELTIEPGAKQGQQIVMEGRGQERPGMKRGHVVFVIEEKPHQIYRREGNDLHRTMDITLKEALLGFDKTIDLFGESIEVAESGVTPHNHVIKIDQKGMPSDERGGFGDMYVSIRVIFPRRLSAEQIALIERAL